ncbi:MAG: hypothetical protein GY705_09915 [Bacteroidetes bacterium]|nr:hypothetical protein [Bacteroidota bacterium]
MESDSANKNILEIPDYDNYLNTPVNQDEAMRKLLMGSCDMQNVNLSEDLELSNDTNISADSVPNFVAEITVKNTTDRGTSPTPTSDSNDRGSSPIPLPGKRDQGTSPISDYNPLLDPKYLSIFAKDKTVEASCKIQ